ncbi:MAG: transcriptional regulator [Pyrinomonadaceae bacterium]
MKSSSNIYKFADFTLDEGDCNLSKNANQVTIGGRNFDVLVTLVSNAPSLVTNEQLVNKVWTSRGFHIEKRNLTTNVSALRKLLGDDQENPRFIKTERGNGYRFIADVEVVSTNETEDKAVEWPTGERDDSGLRDIIDPSLYKCLRTLIKQSPVSKTQIPITGARWIESESDEWYADQISNATKEISIISYSFTHGFNRFDDNFAHFLNKKKVSLRVLMLDPFGPGFALKTGMEALKEPRVNSQQSWMKAVQSTRRAHHADIKSGIAFLENLRTQFGAEKILYSLYSDTPNLRGVLIDGKAGAFSSYFFNPINRGLRSPVLLIDDFDKSPHLQFLKTLFHYWFEINLVVGRKSPD